MRTRRLTLSRRLRRTTQVLTTAWVYEYAGGLSGGGAQLDLQLSSDAPNEVRADHAYLWGADPANASQKRVEGQTPRVVFDLCSTTRPEATADARVNRHNASAFGFGLND